MNIYVGNLSYDLNESELEAQFTAFGEVVSTKIIYDRITNRSKGFGFIEMENDEDAQKAIEALNDKDLKGRPLVVNKAREPKPRR